MLYLDLLGQVRLSVGDARTPLRLTRQCLTLLAFLATTRGRTHPRDCLVERFWPDHPASQARSNLCSAIWRLRRSLKRVDGDVLCSVKYGDVCIESSAEIRLDCEAFEDRLGTALASRDGVLDEAALDRLRTGLELYQGDYMPGWFDDWVLAERERLHALQFRGRLRLLEHHAADGDLEAALQFGLDLLRLDPLRESVHRRVMKLYAQNGEPAQVIRQYRTLARVLRTELDVPPAAETDSLYRELVGASGARRGV